ncbi:MAG: HlyD family efflux transporter periplasmic adaptor subunit [Nostoc sp. CreGUA01]|nr:biotin/lipoyl-binding protein [Nostoc sp. CreGUA01]
MKAIALLLSLGVMGVFTIFGVNSRRYLSANQNNFQEISSNQQIISHVTALGRLEPEGDIIHLSAPVSNQRLAQLRVKEGDRVKVGQVIAIMDNFNQYEAIVENARAKVIVARSRLAQVQAGEEFGEIEAQRKKVAEMEAQLIEGIKVQNSIIARQQVEVRKAENDYQRYKTLSQEGAVSAADTETKRLQLEIEKEKLQEAKANLREQVSTGEERVKESQATLESVKHVKPTDILVAKAELNESLSQLRKAKVDMESTYVQAPLTGQILSVNAKIGEVVGSAGIVDIGHTQQMYVMAEVYESDIQYIKINQPAIIVSEYGGFTGEIKGIVDRIGLQIDKPGIVNDDPSARADVRIVKVKIRLHSDDSERVRTLNKLQVRASIQIR